jgi:hypothetical protein
MAIVERTDPMRMILVACLVAAACAPESAFVFPGWTRILATDAAAYCEAHGAVIVDVPETDREITEASDACLLAEETGPCWVGTPTETDATEITIDGYVISVPRDLGPALALCRAPTRASP